MSLDEALAGYDELDEDAEEGGAARVAPVSVPELKSLLALAVGVVVVAALYAAKDVLVPITLAILLSFVLSPIVYRLERIGVWRAPSVILSVLVALGFIAALGTLLGAQAASLAGDAPRYAATIETKAEGLRSSAMTRISGVENLFAKARASGATTNTVQPGSPGTTTRPSARPVPVEVVGGGSTPLQIARTIVAPVLAPVETILIVLIVAIFILLQKEDLRDRFIRLFGSSDLHRTTLAMNDAGERLSRYFLSQLAVNTCFGIVIGAGLWLIGIPSPILWGVLAGLFRFVPYIGPFLAALAPAALAAAIDPGWAMAIEVVLLFVVVEPLTGYVVEPMLYGHSTGLSPVSVIVAAIFWTWLWGPIGLILSTPLTLCLVVTGRHVKSLEFFDVLLGDRPALSMVDSFYQRMLADNSNELFTQAETILSDSSLLAYYDEVMIPALRLASADYRKLADSRQSRRMLRTVRTLIDDLGEREAGLGEAPVNGSRYPIACVAGSGPFDAALNRVAAQLLEGRGHKVAIVPHAATSRDAICTLELDAALVVICYLDLPDNRSRVQLLIRRLRSRAPESRIATGLISDETPTSKARADEGVHGTDRTFDSLAELMEIEKLGM